VIDFDFFVKKESARKRFCEQRDNGARRRGRTTHAARTMEREYGPAAPGR
jgi:hypothetical protein